MVQLLKQKGVFNYDYIDKFERHDNTALSTRGQFYNRLAGEDCSEVEYARAQRVWKDFKFQHIDDFIRFYLVSDVARIAYVVQMFRHNSLDEHQLDSSYYMSAP